MKIGSYLFFNDNFEISLKKDNRVISVLEEVEEASSMGDRGYKILVFLSTEFLNSSLLTR